MRLLAVLSFAVGPSLGSRVDAGDPVRLRPPPQESCERLRWLQRNTKALALDVRIVMMEALSCDAPKAPAG